MTKNLLIIIVAAAFSVAMGKALDYLPVPQWMKWTILMVILFAGIFVLQGLPSD